MVNILVVCHGNVMRSPLAQGLLLKHIHSEKRINFQVLSAGFTSPNRVAAKKVREFAATVGVDLSKHRSSVVSSPRLKWADQVVYMDQRNYDKLEESGAVMDNCVCLANYINESVIKDPCFIPRGPEFTKIMNQIVSATEEYWESIK